MDDALEPDHREKSGAESSQAGQKENAKRQQRLPACWLCQSTRKASFAPSSTRGAGSTVSVHRAPGIGGRFVLAVVGCVVLRHFCVGCRLGLLARPSSHAPVSPSAPCCCKLPKLVPTFPQYPIFWVPWVYIYILIHYRYSEMQPLHPVMYTPPAPHPVRNSQSATRFNTGGKGRDGRDGRGVTRLWRPLTNRQVLRGRGFISLSQYKSSIDEIDRQAHQWKNSTLGFSTDWNKDCPMLYTDSCHSRARYNGSPFYPE